jgi:hypothetical protein
MISKNKMVKKNRKYQNEEEAFEAKSLKIIICHFLRKTTKKG